MVKVSIIVPVYNVEKYIKASVESMIAQTCADIEIIFVDDGSTDDSGKICDDFAGRDSRIKVIHKENGGVSSARNAGMDIAGGKYIYFCDPDDIISTELVSDNFKLMEKNNAQVCVFGFELFKDRGGEIVSEIKCAPSADKCLDYKGFWDNFKTTEKLLGTSICTRMFLKSFIDENNIRFCNMQTNEDTWFLYDVYECGFKKIVYNSGIYYKYIRRSGGAMSVYKADRLEINFRLSDRLKSIIESCDHVKGRYNDIIYRSYVNAASGGFRYLTVFSPGKMYAVVKEYMSRSIVKESFSELNLKDIEGGKRRLRLFLLKYGMYRLYTGFSYLYKFANK